MPSDIVEFLDHIDGRVCQGEHIFLETHGRWAVDCPYARRTWEFTRSDIEFEMAESEDPDRINVLGQLWTDTRATLRELCRQPSPSPVSDMVGSRIPVAAVRPTGQPVQAQTGRVSEAMAALRDQLIGTSPTFSPFNRTPFVPISQEDLEYLRGQPVQLTPRVEVQIEGFQNNPLPVTTVERKDSISLPEPARVKLGHRQLAVYKVTGPNHFTVRTLGEDRTMVVVSANKPSGYVLVSEDSAVFLEEHVVHCLFQVESLPGKPNSRYDHEVDF